MWKFVFLVFLAINARTVKGVQEVGDECEYHEDCADIGNAVCNTAYNFLFCECTEGYVASSNKSVCLPLALKIGDECEVPEQCANIPNAKCNNNSCVVDQAFTKPPVLTKQTEKCSTASNCSTLLEKRVCVNATCTAELPPMPPKSISSTIIPDIFELGKPCGSNADCTAEGSLCIDKQCKCTENLVPAQNLKSCLPKAKMVGDTCSENAQCLSLNGSTCENDKCTQKIQKIQRMFTDLEENLPIVNLMIGSNCQNDKECQHIINALCVENVCQCKENYVTSPTSDSCLEKAKKEGDPCEIDKQCEAIKGATCIQKKCVKPGFVGTKLGNPNGGSTIAVSQLLTAILFANSFFV